jgi:hypothetical protein
MQQTIRYLLAVLALTLLPAGPAAAGIDFFGTAKIKPTFYSNFDFQSAKNDAFIINEGGLTGGHHTRAELRLGWKAAGDNWSVKMIAEADVIMEKDTADRSYYVDSVNKEGKPNSGSEFGIERVELLYRFLPWLELESGWDIRALDIKTGGLLYGDDHPFLGFRGDITPSTRYELLYLPIQNRSSLPSSYDTEKVLRSPDADDWNVYTFKLTQDLSADNNSLPQSAFFGNSDGKNSTLSMSVGPIVAYSDNDSKQAQVTY